MDQITTQMEALAGEPIPEFLDRTDGDGIAIQTRADIGAEGIDEDVEAVTAVLDADDLANTETPTVH